MKAIKYIPILILATALCTTACNDDDFLEEDARTVYTTANSYETVDQVKATITNLYVHIRYWYQIDFFLKGLGTDILDIPYFRCAGSGYCNFSSWSSSYETTENIFNALYQLANYANQSLAGYNTEGLNWDSEEDKAEDYGQIMFFRGYAYLTLAELFGGVPLVDQFYEELKLDFERATREETYEFAIADLKEAAENLPDYPSEAGRVAKGAAYHFLAEAYLALAIEKDNSSTELQQAISYATQVMNMHPLMTERFGTRAEGTTSSSLNGCDAYYEDGDVFFDLFQRGNYDYVEGNTEALWTLQNDYTIYHTYGGNDYVPSPRNMSPVLRDVTWADATGHASKGPWYDNIDTDLYPGGNVSAYVGGRGIASYAPTTYAIDEVWDGDYYDDIRNSSANIRRYFVCMDTEDDMYGEEVPYELLGSGSGSTYSEFFPAWTKVAPIDDWGYEDVDDGGNRSNFYYDQYACRSAETLLLRAEAYLRAGNTSSAVADINELRTRAQCSYLISSSDLDLQFILDERVRELYYEERRWVTLLRMGEDGINSINNHAMYIVDQPFYNGTFSASQDPITKWTLFPIPQTVIDSNTDAVITQNEGW